MTDNILFMALYFKGKIHLLCQQLPRALAVLYNTK